jgi:hypothetical protein
MDSKYPDCVKRRTDSLEGDIGAYLEVSRGGSGDMFVEIRGQDRQGNPVVSRIQFLSQAGGGHHPKTILALYDLMTAMYSDNQDKCSPERYR